MSKLYTRVSTLKPVTDEDMLNLRGKYLQKFALTLTQHMRGIKFGTLGTHDVTQTHMLWVYMDEQPFAMGYIGYGDWQTEVTGDSKFVVYAHTIINGKYSYGDQQKIATSVHLDKGIKNAKKYLRNFDALNIAQAELDGIRSAFNSIKYTVQRTKQSKWDSITSGAGEGVLLSEFRNMIASGYEFVDNDLRDKVQEYITSVDENNDRSQKTLDVAFVRVFNKFGEQTFEVVRMYGLHKMSRPPKDDVETYTNDTLPADLMGKLTTLNMVAHKDYVEGVGFNSGDGMFYVQL